MTKQEAITVADIILVQLGGFRTLRAFLNAQNIYPGEDGSLSFKFSGNRKVNYCKITLNGKDLYDVEFKQIRNFNLKPISTHNDIYCDQLKELFERETGLYLSF